MLTATASNNAIAETTADMANLTPENAAFASRSLDFIEKMGKIYFDTADRLNGIDNQLEELYRDNEDATWEVKVARGPVMEKAGHILTTVKKGTWQSETKWARFFVMTVHPKTPLVGIMQASFIVQFFPDDTSSVAGVIDIMPAAMHEDDLDEIRQAVDIVYQAYGKDGEKYRRQSCEGSGSEDMRYRRRSACVGGNFFGREMMSVTEENFTFYSEAYQTFVESYLDVLERRKDDHYTDDDIAIQDTMRKNWFEDRLFVDPNTTNFTPYEIWSLYSLPPTVKF